MPNPITIDTANVSQFGFNTVFDLENSELVFNIEPLTIFKPGGEALVVGINFEVIDPSGIIISQINWANTPNIVPSVNTTYTVPIANNIAKFGEYQIKGVLREQNGVDYAVEFDFDVCQPNGFDDPYVKANYLITVDCDVPKIRFLDQTTLRYKEKTPYSIERQYAIKYPANPDDPAFGDIKPPITNIGYTPIDLVGPTDVYSGEYRFRGKVYAYYDLGNYVSLKIAYAGMISHEVSCLSELSRILCCLEEIQSTLNANCGTNKSKAIMDKLGKARLLLDIAYIKERIGQSAGVEVDKIAEILDCDCGCGGSKKVTPVYSKCIDGSNPATCGSVDEFSAGFNS